MRVFSWYGAPFLPSFHVSSYIVICFYSASLYYSLHWLIWLYVLYYKVERGCEHQGSIDNISFNVFHSIYFYSFFCHIQRDLTMEEMCKSGKQIMLTFVFFVIAHQNTFSCHILVVIISQDTRNNLCLLIWNIYVNILIYIFYSFIIFERSF